MHSAIAIGQGVGLAVACGLVAFIPLGVGAIAAMLGALPGSLSAYHHALLVTVSIIVAVASTATSFLRPAWSRLALAGVGGGVSFELAAGHALPIIGAGLGFVLGMGAGWIADRVLTGSLARGATRSGIAVMASGGALVAAALALVPFAGYLALVGCGWFAARVRRHGEATYAGLRSLR